MTTFAEAEVDVGRGTLPLRFDREAVVLARQVGGPDVFAGNLTLGDFLAIAFAMTVRHAAVRGERPPFELWEIPSLLDLASFRRLTQTMSTLMVKVGPAVTSVHSIPEA